MNQLNNLLASRGHSKHHGQSLWKYNLSDLEFYHLRKVLMENKRLSNLDPTDCTLYYAEWWKRCYNGGFPSKRDVFNSIANGQLYDEEAFYQQAKKGANILGIRWIKNQNTLYFRTLLLQGGLPIKHISNHKGAYKSFLLKILELNPRNIDDFAFDAMITSLLPASSRNDEVYECCLDIVKAIINEDREYLALLDNHEDLNDISSELRVRKQSLSFGRKKTKFRANWVFEPDEAQIRLYLGVPQEMDSEDFRGIFLGGDSNLPMDFEYRLFYNNQILCKFVKKTNQHYKTIWVNQGELRWDGTDRFSELYAVNSGGHKYDCKHLITYLPKLDKPTLWTKYSEAQWILEKGCHTSQQEGFVLFPDAYAHNNEISEMKVNLFGGSFKWMAFTNSLVLYHQSERHQFKTSAQKIEWSIIEEKPAWIHRANVSVVRRKPKVSLTDDAGNAIHNAVLTWRQKSSSLWNNWNLFIPHGLIELQIQVGDIIEYDEFFNIGPLDIKTTSNSLHQAEVELVKNTFIFHIHEDQFLDIAKLNANTIGLKLKSNTNIPSAIQAYIKISHQSTGLRFEMLPPFKGVEIIDNEQRIVPNGAAINLTQLNGYRLMTNTINMVAHLYNTKRKSIIITERLHEDFIPLRVFDDKINQLYTLSDSMDGDAEIALEVYEESAFIQTKVREYKIKRYDQKIDWSFDEHQELKIQINAAGNDLYAVPLDCTHDELNLFDLEYRDGGYVFRTVPQLEKFVLFCSKDSALKIQPAFISLNPKNELTTTEDRTQRIINFRDKLLSATYTEDSWNQLLSYYIICLNNDLSYSTFDMLRAVGFSSALAAKTFVFLLCYDGTESFSEDAHKKMEQDLGFSFHWVNRDHWLDAMNWIGYFQDPQLGEIIRSGLRNYFNNLYPSAHFSQIFNYVSQNTKPRINGGYHLNGRISSLRASLGPKVLSELPQKCPKVPDPYKNIISVTDANTPVKILLQSPLAVALSIAGKDETLWSKESEFIRRNVLYSYQLNPEWYSEAINYCLTKL